MNFYKGRKRENKHNDDICIKCGCSIIVCRKYFCSLDRATDAQLQGLVENKTDTSQNITKNI
jgi:hypothetical protein